MSILSEIEKKKKKVCTAKTMTNSDAYLSLSGTKYVERKLVLVMKGREKSNSEEKMRGRTGAVLLRARPLREHPK